MHVHATCHLGNFNWVPPVVLVVFALQFGLIVRLQKMMHDNGVPCCHEEDLFLKSLW